jgi:dTDP-4-amino-4,6-dideoxygalactose transaminase
MIPYENLKLLNHQFEEKMKTKFSDFLQKGWYILGEELNLFEKEFAAWHQEKYVVGVANGLDALILSLRCCNLPMAAEVIVPSNTYIATILAIIHCGFKPVLVEPCLDSYNIDPPEICAAITSKTAAIIVVHLYGLCCDMDSVMQIAEAHQLKVIEDCAQAHGSTYKGGLAGTFGDFGAFSFYPTKNLGALGDAGAIICKNSDDEKALRQLRNYGSEKKYHNGIVGYNSRLDELHASFLRIKLPYLTTINDHKRKLAAIYDAKLNEHFIKPRCIDDYHHVYHIYNIRHPERDRMRQYLANHGIGTEVHYPVAPHNQPALKGYLEKYDFPISETIHQTTLSLPCSFAHTEKQIELVCDIINKF